MRKALLGGIVAAAALAATLAVGAGCKVSTANLSDARVCAKVDADGVCPADAPEIPSGTDIIHATAVLRNAPPDTPIKVSWRYLEAPDGGFDIDSATFVAKEPVMALHGVLTRPDNGWPKGRYEVVLAVDADNVEPVRKTFAIP